DILETFVDRGQLRKLTKPTLTPTGKRVPGLKLDNPRQLALMHALAASHRSQRPGPSQHRRSLSACRCRPGLHHRAVQLGLASIQPLQAPRERPCRKAAPLSPLPAAGRGIFRLPDLPLRLTRMRTALKPARIWSSIPRNPRRSMSPSMPISGVVRLAAAAG